MNSIIENGAVGLKLITRYLEDTCCDLKSNPIHPEYNRSPSVTLSFRDSVLSCHSPVEGLWASVLRAFGVLFPPAQ